MARKSVLRWFRVGVAAVSWAAAAWLADGAGGSDIGGAGHELEERIEWQLRGHGGAATPADPPQRTHDDAIEPWELVSV